MPAGARGRFQTNTSGCEHRSEALRSIENTLALDIVSKLVFSIGNPTLNHLPPIGAGRPRRRMLGVKSCLMCRSTGGLCGLPLLFAQENFLPWIPTVKGCSRGLRGD
jgi:hypothetical protein